MAEQVEPMEIRLSFEVAKECTDVELCRRGERGENGWYETDPLYHGENVVGVLVTFDPEDGVQITLESYHIETPTGEAFHSHLRAGLSPEQTRCLCGFLELVVKRLEAGHGAR